MRTGDGKVVLFDAKTGAQASFWPIDAKAILAAGSHTMEPPAGVKPVEPVKLPKHVGVPKAAEAPMFVAPEHPEPSVARGRKAPKAAE